MRATHDDGHSGGANRVRHAVGLGDHTSHRADTHSSNIVFADEFRDASFIHRLGVAVN
jgi:hypothetical protein